MDAVLIVALNEVFSLTNSPMMDMSGMAAMIRSHERFRMLRFEEVLFALKKGINNGYGKIYGNLSYQHISEWIETYMDTDRAAAVDMRNQERQGHRKMQMKEAHVDDESVMGRLLKIYHDKREEEKAEAIKTGPTVSRDGFDRSLLKNIMQMQDKMEDHELERLQGLATEAGYRFTAEHIGEELERRYTKEEKQ